jgi:hypothetical protein
MAEREGFEPSVLTGGMGHFSVQMVTLDQVQQLVARNQQTDGSSLARQSLDKAMSFERQDHLVYERREDLEVSLHFGLRRWVPVDFSVVVNDK